MYNADNRMPSILDLLRRKSVSGSIPPSVTSGIPFVGSFKNNGFYQGASRLFRSRNREEYLEEYRGYVFACVQAIGEDVANINLRLYSGKGPDKKEVFDHPVIDLLHSVNDVMTSDELFFNTQASLELDGNAFWYLQRNGSGLPESIWVLRPDLVDPIPGKDKWVENYAYKVGSKKYAIAPENMVHFKTYNPLNPYRGVGTVMAAMASIDSQNSIKAWNQAFFDNGARPDTIIEFSGNLSEIERQRLEREWDDQYKGPTKAHRASFLGNGLKVITLDVSQKEMDFVAQNQLSRDEILSIFRVPQSVLGITQDMTYANAETTDYIFAKRTVKPKMRRLATQLNEFFLPNLGYPELHFEFDDPTPNNQELKLQTYTNGITNGWLTPNEIRKAEGRPPVTGGNNVLVPSSLVPGGEVIEPVAPKIVHAPKEKTAASVLKNIVQDFAKSAKESFAEVQKSQDFESRGKAWNTKQRESGDHAIADMKDGMVKFFDDQKKRVIENLKAELTKAAKQKRARTKAVNPDNVFNSDTEKQALIDYATTVLKPVVKKEGQDAIDLTGSDVEFDANADAVTKMLAKQTKKFAGKVTKDTSTAIRDNLAEGLQGDESFDELVSRIQDLAAFDDSRAEMIARTEVTRAQANTDIQAWDQSGVVSKKIWYTAEDERVCPHCDALHGEESDLHESFLKKGEELEGTDDTTFSTDYGDVDGPPLHPSCRCSILPVVE